MCARVGTADGGTAGCAVRNVPYLLASPDKPGTGESPVDGGASPAGSRNEDCVGVCDSETSSLFTGVYTTRGRTSVKNNGINTRTRNVGKKRCASTGRVMGNEYGPAMNMRLSSCKLLTYDSRNYTHNLS